LNAEQPETRVVDQHVDLQFLLAEPVGESEAGARFRQVDRLDVHRHVRAGAQLAGQRLELAP
jgi:hypothetical protein